MQNKMLIALLSLPLVAWADSAESPPSPTPVTANMSCTVSNEFWLTPRSGILVQADATLAPCLHAVLDDLHTNLLITYPNNDDATVEANELRQWLLALALPASRIHTQKQDTNTTILLETRHD